VRYIYNKTKKIVKRIVRLTESDLSRLVKRVIMETEDMTGGPKNPKGSKKPEPKEGDYGVYCVKRGDTLSGIAQKFKGQFGLSKNNPLSDLKAYNTNRIPDPNKINTGLCLFLTAAS
jgi:LysM repeat protein